MKLDTKVHMLIRSVGEEGSEDNIFVVYDTLSACILAQAKWIHNHELKRRFDICFGRSEEECRARLLLVAKTRNPKPGKTTMSDVDKMLDDMLAEKGVTEL